MQLIQSEEQRLLYRRDSAHVPYGNPDARKCGSVGHQSGKGILLSFIRHSLRRGTGDLHCGNCVAEKVVTVFREDPTLLLA